MRGSARRHLDRAPGPIPASRTGAGSSGRATIVLQTDAEYMAAPDQTLEPHETPLPRGSHPYTVRVTIARGFVTSLRELSGLGWSVPDFRTLSRPLPGRRICKMLPRGARRP